MQTTIKHRVNTLGNKPLINTYLLPFLLGAFAVLGFAPYYVYPASIISLIGLFYIWNTAETAKQTLVSGFYYGLGLFGVGIYWIYISLHDFGGMPAWIAVFCTFLLCAFLAIFPALVGYLCKKYSAISSSSLMLCIPLFWTLLEWVRSWIFTGFPWLTIGYSQAPHGPLAGFMPIVGVYGVSFITVLFSSLMAFWLVNAKKLSALWQRKMLAILLCIWLGGSLLKLIEWTKPINESISVALLQGNIPQDMKWSPDIAQQTLDTYLTMAQQSQAQLIIMPETALPMLASKLPQQYLTQLKNHAISNHGDILMGAVEGFEATNATAQNQYFNSLLSIGTAKTQSYRKSHLVPFGEFIPLKNVLGWIYRDFLNMPLSDLSRGSTMQKPMEIVGQKVAINICYEDVFGEEIIRQLPQATLLVNVSNDAWYGKSPAAHQHMQFSQVRALETGRMMLRATNTGATVMIDTHGEIVAHAPHFSKTTLEVSAQGYEGSTPYVRWGNWPILILLWLGTLGMLYKGWLKNRKH